MTLPKDLKTPQMVTELPVDFAQAASKWQTSQAFLVREFGLR
jgi:hypothetical protein